MIHEFKTDATTPVQSSNTKDSITTVISPNTQTKKTDQAISHPTKSYNSTDSKIEKPITTSNNTITQTPPVEKEDFSTYLNTAIAKTYGNIEVYVTIIDENKCTIESTVSNSIADIYSNSGKNGKIGLLRSNFISKHAFKELFEGNSDIIEKLKLKDYTDYLVLGKIHYTYSSSKEVANTAVCNISMTVSLISAKDKTYKSFPVEGNGNGPSESYAKQEALNNLFYNYSQEHSSL